MFVIANYNIPSPPAVVRDEINLHPFTTCVGTELGNYVSSCFNHSSSGTSEDKSSLVLHIPLGINSKGCTYKNIVFFKDINLQ